MMPSSPLYCDACGAANQTQATRCWVCGQLLAASTENTVSASSPPAQPPASLPALLVGRYRLMSTMSTGDFGAVYKAQDMRRNDAPVAIQSIDLHHLSPAQIIEATETFNREMRLLSILEHPNLPHIQDHFTDPEHCYLVMDFIEGQTLEEYLSHTKDGYLPVEEVLETGVQLCTVLQYLHTHQPPIIFHDVKPAPIMRTPVGQLYLIDFGLARHFTPGQARDTSALGSPGSAAPEQQTPVQTDIYSLGATLRYLLTGKDASGSTSGKASPDGQDQQAPGLLEQFFLQMQAVDADKRPESMNVVKRVLEQIQLAGLFYEWGAPRPGSLPPRVLPARRPLHSPAYAVQQTPFKQKRYEEALAACEQALWLDPSDLRAYIGKGNALDGLKRHQEALAACEQAIRLDPNFALAYKGKGNALNGLKRYEEALMAYEQAIQLDPNYALAYSNKGDTLSNLKRHEEALAACEQAIRLDPSYVHAYVNKDNALDGLKRYEEALMAYEQAIRLDPSDLSAYKGRGHALNGLKRHEEALMAYEQAIRLDPNLAGSPPLTGGR